MTRPHVKALSEKKKLQQTQECEFLIGVRCGVFVSMQLIKSGSTDMENFEAEVLSRVREK
jgi:hypothetical protein